jgi:hypothetical protein
MDLDQLLRELSEDTTQTDSSSVGSNIYNSGNSRRNAGNDSSGRSNSGTATRTAPSVGNVSGRSNTFGISGVGRGPASPSSVDSNSPSSGRAASSCDSNSRPAPRRQSWQCGSNCPHIACGNNDSTARRNNYPPNSGNDDCAESDRSPQAPRPRYTNRTSSISSQGRYSALPSGSRQLACGSSCAHVFCGRFDRNARSRGPNSGPARSDSPASPVPGGSYSDAVPPGPFLGRFRRLHGELLHSRVRDMFPVVRILPRVLRTPTPLATAPPGLLNTSPAADLLNTGPADLRKTVQEIRRTTFPKVRRRTVTKALLTTGPKAPRRTVPKGRLRQRVPDESLKFGS